MKTPDTVPYEVEYLDLDEKTRVKVIHIDKAWQNVDNIRTIAALKLGKVHSIRKIKREGILIT